MDTRLNSEICIEKDANRPKDGDGNVSNEQHILKSSGVGESESQRGYFERIPMPVGRRSGAGRAPVGRRSGAGSCDTDSNDQDDRIVQ